MCKKKHGLQIFCCVYCKNGIEEFRQGIGRRPLAGRSAGKDIAVTAAGSAPGLPADALRGMIRAERGMIWIISLHGFTITYGVIFLYRLT